MSLRDLDALFGEPPPEEIDESHFAAWLESGAPGRDDLVARFGLSYWSVFGSIRRRERVIARYGFAIPCREAIQTAVAAGPLVELGAGTGYWSALIARAGGDVLACDIDDGGYGFAVGHHHPVERRDAADFVRQHPARNALIVWPSYGGDWACRAAEALAIGRTLLLVGEGPGGCTGNDRLFHCLGTAFAPVAEVPLPVWPGIHDFLGVFRKVA